MPAWTSPSSCRWSSLPVCRPSKDARALALTPVPGYTRPRLVARTEWEIMEGQEKVASRSAVPLKLAWALSIHKSQGMTIDRLLVDLAGVFEFGQAYVALSRCSSLEGLSVTGYRKGVVFAHPDVVRFYAQLAADVANADAALSKAPPKSQGGSAPYLSKAVVAPAKKHKMSDI